MRADDIWPRRSTAEIVLRLGDRATFVLDHDADGDEPPCLCVQDGSLQLLLYPLSWVELGEVTEADLERAGDLVIDATRWRDAIFRKLQKQSAADVPAPVVVVTS